MLLQHKTIALGNSKYLVKVEPCDHSYIFIKGEDKCVQPQDFIACD